MSSCQNAGRPRSSRVRRQLAPMAEGGDLAQLVVAVIGAEVGAESVAQVLQAFPRTLVSRVVAHADEGGVAGVIAVGDDIIERGAALDELVKEMVLAQGRALPDVVAKPVGEGARQGIGDGAILEVLAARLFSGAGVMDVAQYAERAGAHGVHVGGAAPAPSTQPVARGGVGANLNRITKQRAAKSEIRSSKPETNPKSEVGKLKTAPSPVVSDLPPFPAFGFVSGFELRISDFTSWLLQFVSVERASCLHHSESGRSREEDLERGALARLAFHANGTPMVLDDTPRDGQAQAGAVGFGGEKRFK